MNEIEKMYENAQIEKKWNKLPYGEIEEYYPPFTAEKQLKLIKWLSDTDYYIHNIYKTIDTKEYCIENYYYDIQADKFEEALAQLVNDIWQDLTTEEKQQIKEILSE